MKSRREALAEKGRLLYERACGGDGACAEEFALYHLRRGEADVVEAFVAFLEQRREALEDDDPEGRLEMTRRLIARIRERLEEAR